MKHRNKTLFATLFALVGLGACSKNTETQIQKYLAFYYPSGTDTSYEISFEWGVYDIYTTEPAVSGPAGDEARYGGYIIARPTVDRATPGERYWTYLVTPDGKVWRRIDGGSIPASGHRKKVTVSNDGNATTTTTLTIESPAEPVIDDFLRQPEVWSRYGALVARGTGDYRLLRTDPPRSDRISP